MSNISSELHYVRQGMLGTSLICLENLVALLLSAWECVNERRPDPT